MTSLDDFKDSVILAPRRRRVDSPGWRMIAELSGKDLAEGINTAIVEAWHEGYDAAERKAGLRKLQQLGQEADAINE